MKTKDLILLFLISFVGGTVFYSLCKYTFERKQTELKDKARTAFIEAVNHEVKSKGVEGPLLFNIDSKSVADDMPDSVYIEDELGKHWYVLDPMKNHKNVTNNTNLRFLHSFIFEKYPIVPDTLNSVWHNLLENHHINFNSALSVTVVDGKGKITSQNVSMLKWVGCSSLIFTAYIGYACEIEVKGYLDYSIWNLMLTDILIYFLLCFLVFSGVYKAVKEIRKRVIRLQQKKIVEIVNRVDNTAIRAYKLRDNIIFYAEKKIVTVNEVEKKVPKQANQLLELFLVNEKNGYIVSDDEIMNNLWPDGTGYTERIHKAVGRLRIQLHKIDSSIEIERGIETYQLLI